MSNDFINPTEKKIILINKKKIANNLRIWRNKQTLSVKNSPKK